MESNLQIAQLKVVCQAESPLSSLYGTLLTSKETARFPNDLQYDDPSRACIGANLPEESPNPQSSAAKDPDFLLESRKT